jgi:hypothetical protein
MSEYARNDNNQLSYFGRIPKTLKIGSKTIMNAKILSEETLRDMGFYPYIAPVITQQYQREGNLILQDNIVTREVIPWTQQEINDHIKNIVMRQNNWNFSEHSIRVTIPVELLDIGGDYESLTQRMLIRGGNNYTDKVYNNDEVTHIVQYLKYILPEHETAFNQDSRVNLEFLQTLIDNYS